MSRTPSAGDLRDKFIFFKRIKTDDGAGNQSGEWAEQFSRRARLTFRDGNEAVIAARLSGKQPAFLLIRKSSETDQITTEWCCRDAHTGTDYNIRAVSFDPATRQYLKLNIEAGVPLG